MTIAFGFDQILDSAIRIPGAIPVDEHIVSKSAIRIDLGPSQTNARAPLYTRVDDELMFSAADIASYQCQPDRIEVRPCPGSDPEWVTALLIATAIPAALWMQGRFVLHAAAIVLDGSCHCIAIAGPSGAGKSVLARQLLEQGARLLADDSVALVVTDKGIIASGLPGGTHCWTGNGDDRSFQPVPLEQSVTSAPLAAIILLDELAGAFASTALAKLAAVERIIACQHRPSIPAMLGGLGAALTQAAAIADRVPVSVWNRSNGEIVLSGAERELLWSMLPKNH